MRLLADPNITDATITATNRISFKPESNMQNFVLSRRFESSGNNTQIVVDFGSTVPDITAFVLCGTSLTSSAIATLGFSNTDPGAPDDTIALPVYSELNQVWFFDTAHSYRYWIIDITDSQPIKIGYLYTGEYTQIERVSFPSSPVNVLYDNPSVSATGQPFGQGGYVGIDWTFVNETIGDTAYNLIANIWKRVQRIIPIVVFPLEGHLDKDPYRPIYSRFTNDTLPYAMDGQYFVYSPPFNTREAF